MINGGLITLDDSANLKLKNKGLYVVLELKRDLILKNAGLIIEN
ncbi:hypothetical protein B4080_1987 [Bacillus cereus]|nr:hypothetical protein B4080_1987 [Bacillus cereus]